MLADCRTMATIPVRDPHTVRSFYTDTLGLKILSDGDEGIVFEGAGGTAFLVFPSAGAASGSHTQLSFLTDDMDTDAADLRARGVTFERFDMPDATEVDGVYDFGGFRGAWFRDPEGNLLAISEIGEELGPG